MIGKTISHYRIIDKIGQGGMGVVYRAEDTTLHRTVALKFLPPHLAGATQEMTRFVHEARAAAALSHPNICTIYEIDEKADPPFIAMEYIEGKSLKEIMEDGGPLELAEALRYALQVGRALEEAHARGVTHRDIKSANIVVSERGHAIVMDFGLAKTQGQTKLTQTGTTVGTVAYMSPEQTRGEEANHRADIWSLGVVLYRMIAGRYPFEADHQAAVMYSIMNEPHRALTSLRTDVPLELERVVNKMLAKEPDERYQSVSDLIVDLKAVRNQLGGTGSSAAAPVQTKSRSSRRPLLYAGAAAVAAIAGFLVWQQLSGDKDASTKGSAAVKDDRVSIAVLPLSNMSPDESQEYIADGMTEALIAELAQIRALRVISRTSVMRFKNTTQPIPEVAKTLGVNTIIEGSVMQAGGRMRVTAQLIDANTDEHLWAQSYERDMSDVLALQGEVARAIAAEVKVELTPDETERLTRSSAIDPRAYDLYMRGRHHWFRRTKTDLENALELFQQAVDIEPEWGQAYSALAQTVLVMANWENAPPGQAYPRAQELAQQALAFDPGLGSAWACLGGIESEWHWDWDKADEYFGKAIELEPNNASSHQWYAEFLVAVGRFDEALDHINIAEENDPLALIILVVKAWIYELLGDYDRAIDICERVIEMDPGFDGAYILLGDACRDAGQFDRATNAYARYYGSIIPGADESIHAAYENGGFEAVATVLIEGMRQALRARYVSPASMGLRFASIGEVDSAMVWFEKAYQERAFPLSQIAVTPECRVMRDDPRFVDLLRRMNLDGVKPGYAQQ